MLNQSQKDSKLALTRAKLRSMHSELSYGLSFAPKLQRVGTIHLSGSDQPTPDPSFSHGSSLGFGSLSSLSSVSGTSFRRVAPIGIIAVLALLHAIPVAFSHLFIISKSFSSLPSTGSAASAALAESSDGNLA